jgi:hypothetical protein
VDQHGSLFDTTPWPAITVSHPRGVVQQQHRHSSLARELDQLSRFARLKTDEPPPNQNRHNQHPGQYIVHEYPGKQRAAKRKPGAKGFSWLGHFITAVAAAASQWDISQSACKRAVRLSVSLRSFPSRMHHYQRNQKTRSFNSTTPASSQDGTYTIRADRQLCVGDHCHRVPLETRPAAEHGRAVRRLELLEATAVHEPS